MDTAGVVQAAALTDELARVPVRRILTSPASRCVQTVEPLGRRLGRKVEPVADLLPNGGGDAVWRLVAALDATAAVICTHGEVMRPLLADLRAAGATITAKRHDDDWLLQKGTGWALTLDPTGAVVALDHLAPHPVRSCPVHDPPTP